MKHTKHVTGAVRAANRANAQSSTGPRTEKGKAMASHNAFRHSILSKKVELDEDEEREYHGIWKSWNEYYGPKGTLEEFLVDEIINIS